MDTSYSSTQDSQENDGDGRSSSPSSASTCITEMVTDECRVELSLLNINAPLEEATEEHEVVTAPLLTRDAYVSAGMAEKCQQYGVLGSVVAIKDKAGRYAPEDPRLYVNTNAPFSTIICGVQGSGKSHTVSVLLENMLISGFEAIGVSEKALSGLVLHFGEGGAGTRPCEAAWVGCSDVDGVRPPPIMVYVSRSSLSTMRKAYKPLGDCITVKPLLFSEKELDLEAILSMMAVGSSESAPLYMHRVMTILRDLGEKFTYARFLKRVEKAMEEFSPQQRVALEQRLVLLKAFVDDTSTAWANPRFKAGQLTIIDLSDPFVDPGSACSLFEIVTRMFVRAEVNTGKVLVVDEAHKYLSLNRGTTGLARALTSLIRQQRHLAMRVIISTQEPTALPPVLIDLCSMAVLHRFSSPAWWDAIVQHVSADFSSDDDAFDHVVKLKTGEAVILAPSGLGKFPSAGKTFSGNPELTQFGRRYLLARTRRRITADGGASRMVIERS
ncbi:hypothetical protein L226DRAFT_498247 [Lentinus tigrinus ALCF2SS1-7]|uniref:AAA+ ATPase domain-containing protein n=1 Tax=Lentinus tigrinus ALCF2SS1-6 TaxID=1328759 RepID=A0A5C2STS0_9APHY|nr:hypothetical protein L227DRAFT_537336 [Lentinus tigrinus ALCF2SS1-6]RPD80653.1 hypothetical protein L226DRAFT_498247 [Lentinus tigrinus ALCF2SS1-7]